MRTRMKRRLVGTSHLGVAEKRKSISQCLVFNERTVVKLQPHKLRFFKQGIDAEPMKWRKIFSTHSKLVI
jgi:hypothetical protein